MLKVGSNAYNRVHYKIRSVRGNACEHDCVDCDRKAQHWSWIQDTDDEDIWNYEARCQRHHFIYDQINVGVKNHSAKLAEKDVLEIRAIHKGGQYGSKKALAERYGISPAQLSGIIYRKYWNHI